MGGLEGGLILDSSEIQDAGVRLVNQLTCNSFKAVHVPLTTTQFRWRDLVGQVEH